jgi:hypothetical protein
MQRAEGEQRQKCKDWCPAKTESFRRTGRFQRNENIVVTRISTCFNLENLVSRFEATPFELKGFLQRIFEGVRLQRIYEGGSMSEVREDSMEESDKGMGVGGTGGLTGSHRERKRKPRSEDAQTVEHLAWGKDGDAERGGKHHRHSRSGLHRLGAV